MAVDSTLLLREVNSIMETGEGIKSYLVSCDIKTPTEWIKPVKFNLIDIERDYEDGYGDVVAIEFIMGLGDYAYRLVPHRDDLIIDLSFRPLYRNTTISDKDTLNRTRRYRGILMEQDNPGMLGRTPQASSIADLNLSGVKSIQMQLIPEALYQIRMASVGRLYRDATTAQVLRSILTETIPLSSGNNRDQVLGVDLVEGYNSKVRKHVVIPHGTPVVSVKRILQEEQGGIYPTGAGCYLQDQHWRIFPLYDTTLWQKTPKTLTILNIPPNRYFGAEQTFRISGNQVVVVAAGDMDGVDEGLFQQLNYGNALRFINTENLLKYDEVGGNKSTVRRQDNIYEFSGVGLKTGMHHARWSEERATSNPFKHYSDMARRNGRYVGVQWMHGDSSLLYPGMPVKFMTATNNKLAVFHGVLLGVQDQRIPQAGGITTSSTKYVASVALKLFLKRQDTPV